MNVFDLVARQLRIFQNLDLLDKPTTMMIEERRILAISIRSDQKEKQYRIEPDFWIYSNFFLITKMSMKLFDFWVTIVYDDTNAFI